MSCTVLDTENIAHAFSRTERESSRRHMLMELNVVQSEY